MFAGAYLNSFRRGLSKPVVVNNRLGLRGVLLPVTSSEQHHVFTNRKAVRFAYDEHQNVVKYKSIFGIILSLVGYGRGRLKTTTTSDEVFI